MKNTVPFVIVALLMIGCVGHKHSATPFDLPEGVVYESQDDIGFQSFRWGTNDSTALFMMSPHPAGLSTERYRRWRAEELVQTFCNYRAHC